MQRFYRPKPMHKASHYLRRHSTLAALLASDGIFFAVTNPAHLSAAGLITGFILLGLTIFILSEALGRAIRRYGAFPSSTCERLSRYAAAAAVLLIGLQSIGQLSAKDVLVLAPLAAGFYWYLGYGKKAQPDQTP